MGKEIYPVTSLSQLSAKSEIRNPKLFDSNYIMLTFKSLPWISLVLLLLTYSSLGWTLANTKLPLYAWGLIAIAILLLIELLTIPWKKLNYYSLILFKSALRSFFISILAAFLLFLMISRFRLFLDTLVILAATILARIDFQTTKLSQTQTFWTLACLSLTGLLIGFILEQLDFAESWG